MNPFYTCPLCGEHITMTVMALVPAALSKSEQQPLSWQELVAAIANASLRESSRRDEAKLSEHFSASHTLRFRLWRRARWNRLLLRRWVIV